MSTVTPVTPAGNVSAPLLATYGDSVSAYKALGEETIMRTVEIEIAFMRASVASGLSVRDQQATLKAGQEKAKNAKNADGVSMGFKVLPDLGVGKVQVWAKALEIIDGAEIAPDTDFREVLNLAWNARRLPEGYKIEGKSLETIKADIPPVTAGKAEGNKAPRKATSRASLTISQITAFIESFIESLPDNVADIDDVTVIEIAKLAKSVSRLSKAVKQAA